MVLQMFYMYLLFSPFTCLLFLWPPSAQPPSRLKHIFIYKRAAVLRSLKFALVGKVQKFCGLSPVFHPVSFFLYDSERHAILF